MKELKSELQMVVRGLKKLSQRIDKIAKRVEKIKNPQNAKKSKAIVALREFPEIDPAILARVIRGKIYPSDIVLGYIIANPDGIDINTLQKKTGFKHKAIKQIIYTLRVQGKVKGKLKEALLNPKYAAGMSRSLYFEA